ncbi:MAG TPA: DUF6599 family protein [Bacteroidales bacterium]|nr:DUF6599 family protein [Bacteroidales bacterium]
MKRYIVLVFLAFSGCVYVLSQAVAMPELEGYRKVSSYPAYTPENLWDFIDGAADNYLSHGFEELTVAEYEKGKNAIKLEVYRLHDNISAFGIYSTERSSGFRFLNIGSQGYRTEDALNFFKGRYYVKIRTNAKSTRVRQMLEPLAVKVADAITGEASMPKTLLDFPEAGKKSNEETYISEGVLGHEFLKGAFRATYELSDLNFSIFILDFKNPEDCRKTIGTYLAKCKMDPDNSSSGKYVLSDGYNGDIFLSWKDARIVIIQGLAKDQTDTADRYTSEIFK